MDPWQWSLSKFEMFVAVIVATTLVFAGCPLRRPRRKKDEYTVQAWIESTSTAQQQNWHKEKKLRDAVSDFHRRFARVPRRLDEVREEHVTLVEKMRSHLRNQGIQFHPEYVGSAYEGVKVAKSEENDDLEFDVLVTMKLPSEWKAHARNVPDITGHVFLSLSDNYVQGQKKTFFDNIVTAERSSSGTTRFFLDGRKTIGKFFEALQNWINASEDIKENILLRRHGPAIQMGVYEQKINSDRPFYTVNVVPALDFEGYGMESLYVAKPVKSRILPDHAAWRTLSSTDTEFSGRYNDERADRLITTHLKYMLDIEEHLRPHLHIVSFAGYKIGTNDNNLEFKVLVVDDRRKNQIEVSQIEDNPDFVRLSLRIGKSKERLNSMKETTSLIAILQQFIMTSRLLNGKVHIRREGLIVRLIVCESDEQTCLIESCRKTPLYYVDAILAYEVGGRLYVARPNEDWYANEMENSKAWRLSYSVEAKDAIGDYGCMKKVLRVLKALRNQEVALAPLRSYHLKTVIIWLIREDIVCPLNSCTFAWNKSSHGERLMDALLKLEKYLKNKNLPHHLLPEVNLMSHIAEDCINSMGCRIHELCTKEEEMMRVLHAPI